MKRIFTIETEVFKILGKELLEIDYPKIYRLAIKDKKNVEKKIKNIFKEKKWEFNEKNLGFACSHLELDLMKIAWDDLRNKLSKIPS